jgi:cyclopropane fatty-acyl-phospholipid synthase-like methyltransferase
LDIDVRRLDVTRLPGVEGPFDLILDIGCYHSLQPEGQARYAATVARLMRPEAHLLLYSFLLAEAGRAWPTEASIRERFGRDFILEKVEQGTFRQRPSAWFTFRRRET